LKCHFEGLFSLVIWGLCVQTAAGQAEPKPLQWELREEAASWWTDLYSQALS